MHHCIYVDIIAHLFDVKVRRVSCKPHTKFSLASINAIRSGETVHWPSRKKQGKVTIKLREIRCVPVNVTPFVIRIQNFRFRKSTMRFGYAHATINQRKRGNILWEKPAYSLFLEYLISILISVFKKLLLPLLFFWKIKC